MKAHVLLSALFVCLTAFNLIKHKSASSYSVKVFKPAMNLVNLKGSVKNIPIPSFKVYMNMFIHSIETLVREMEWKAQLFLNPSKKTTKNTFNFRSIKIQSMLRNLLSLKVILLKL